MLLLPRTALGRPHGFIDVYALRRRATRIPAPATIARAPRPDAIKTPEAPVLASEDFEDFEEFEPLEEEVFCDEEAEVFEALLPFSWAEGFRESAGALDWSLA